MSIENIKYYKDLNHNYLIIKDTEKETGSYQHKMITANKMKYFLSCKIRYVDEECHFYYEISSRQSLSGMFGRGPMDYRQIHRLFECMREALAELENYLLDSRCLVLQPEYIFGNPETEEYFFIYYPYYMKGGTEASYMPLAEFLVEKADHSQDEAAAIVYKIYEMAQDNEFILSAVWNLFTETVPEIREVEENVIDITEEADLTVMGSEGFPADGGEADIEERAPKQLIAAGILAFACMLSASGVFGLQYFFILSAEEMVMSITGGIVLTVMAAALFLYLIFNVCGQRRCRNRKKENAGVADLAEAVPVADWNLEPVSRKAMIPHKELMGAVCENKAAGMEKAE